MSQIIVPISGGTLPVNVPISFVTDSGTATAAANILNVIGSPGVSTSAPGNSNTITITVTNSGFSGTGTTTNNQLLNILVVPTTVGKAFHATCQIIGYDTPNDVAVGGQILVVGRNDGAVTIVASPIISKSEDASLAAAGITVIGLGTNFAVQASGVFGHVIDWHATAEVIFSP